MVKIKYGYLIKGGKIYDTKVKSYSLLKTIYDKNVIYYIKQDEYKRLYLFEPLLNKYPTDKVFQILRFNKYLKEIRDLNEAKRSGKLHYMANLTVIGNYPPKYLKKKKFFLYKTILRLKKQIDNGTY